MCLDHWVGYFGVFHESKGIFSAVIIIDTKKRKLLPFVFFPDSFQLPCLLPGTIDPGRPEIDYNIFPGVVGQPIILLKK